MDQPAGVPAVFEDHLALMLDLQLLAFQSDLTRVISFMIGKEQSARPYPQIGVPEAHHPLSHHDNVPEIVAQMSKINRYHARVVLEVPGQTARDPGRRRKAAGSHDDPLWFGHLEQHAASRRRICPCCWLGGGAGRLKGGRHINFKDKPSMANLLVTLMDKMDVPVEKVGGSNGKIQLDGVSI